MSIISTTKSVSKKLGKKIGQCAIDILGVFTSENQDPVSMSEALKVVHQQQSTLKTDKFSKCTMQIWHTPDNNYMIIMKSSDSKKVLEIISTDSISVPQISELIIDKYRSHSLVFLPVLNKAGKSELFIFHPLSLPAQDIVTQIVNIMNQSRSTLNSEINTSTNSNIPSDSPSLDPSDNDGIQNSSDVNSTIKNNNSKNEEVSSNIVPNVIILNNAAPDDTDPDLHLMNQYLKEIRLFVNNISEKIEQTIKGSTRSHINGDSNSLMLKIPPKSSFIDIVEKIKKCINVAADNDEIIYNPSAAEIVNQLFKYLKLLDDVITSSEYPSVISGVKFPEIQTNSVMFLLANLIPENKDCWKLLGENFGCPKSISENRIDEFHIRKTTTGEHKNYRNLRSYTKPSLRTYDTTEYSTFTDRNESYSYTPPKETVQRLQYQPLPTFSLNEYSSRRNPFDYLPTNSTWNDRQVRFRDLIQQKNGRLGKVTQGRMAETFQDLAVIGNEFVEILSEVGHEFTVRNASYEIGKCPKSYISVMY